MIGEFYEWNETKTKIKKIILIFGSSLYFFLGGNIEWYCIQRLQILEMLSLLLVNVIEIQQFNNDTQCNKDTTIKTPQEM